MKKIFLLLFAVSQLLSIQARADIWDIIEGVVDATHGHSDHRPGYPNYPGNYGPVRCTYVDEGWEEHFRGHNSCGECLSAHGNCIETCYTEHVTCQATGIDYNGMQRTFTVYGDDRWTAERQGYDTCNYQGLSNCSVQNCETQQSRISQRMCR